MLVKNEVILLKIESSYGVDPTPVAASDALLVENIGWSNESLRMNERPVVRGSLGTLQQVFGGTLQTITFDVELKGSGTAGTAPEIGPALLACGFDETIVPATSVTYGPVSDNQDSATIYYYQDGIRYVLTGCRGNVSFNIETGAVPKASFTFTGHVASITDTALVSPTVSSVVPVAVLGSTFSIGGYNAVINAVSLDMSNSIAAAPDMSASDGFGEVRITNRDPNGSYDPEAVLLATDNPHDDLRNGTQMVMTISNIGSVVGNRVSFNMPIVSYRDVSPGDRDGIRTYEIPFGCAETSGDDEIAIAFT